MRKLLRGAFVIARRDFAATVLSKTFLFFLLGPLFPLLFGVSFAVIGASGPSRNQQPVVAVVGDPAEFARLAAARTRLAGTLNDQSIVSLAPFAPEPDLVGQTSRLLASTN